MFFVRFSIGLAIASLLACGGRATSGTSGAGGSGSATSGNSGSSVTSGSGGAAGSVASAVTGSGGGGTVRCNPSIVRCDALPPSCPPGEVPSVGDGCWGDCVPILSCQTEPNCDACLTGFCAEYVAFTTEYRCVLPNLMCSALHCSCLAPYFCVAPFDACSESMGPADVSCGCPAC